MKLYKVEFDDGTFVYRRARHQNYIYEEFNKIRCVSEVTFDTSSQICDFIRDLTRSDITIYEYHLSMHEIIDYLYPEVKNGDENDIESRVERLEHSLHELRHEVLGLTAPHNPNL
jgi:hypothetical protein